ncbi:MAG: aldolase/citrate lyase family protein [Rhodovibrionaceae bacterium]
MRDNPLKQKLQRGERAFGSMVFEFVSPGLPAIAKAAGADYLLYDMEHSGLSMEQIKGQVAAARGLDLPVLVRPPAKQYHLASLLLDLGAWGLMFPMVETAEEAAELVSWTRYPPRGVRGGAFGLSHDDYAPGEVTAKIAAAEARTLILVLIETAKGLDNVEEILAVPGIDVAHVGHFDLSLSLGQPGDFAHPLVSAGIDRIAAAAKAAGKPAACMVPDAETGRAWLARGYSMLSYSADLWLLQESLRRGIAALREDA